MYIYNIYIDVYVNTHISTYIQREKEREIRRNWFMQLWSLVSPSLQCGPAGWRLSRASGTDEV